MPGTLNTSKRSQHLMIGLLGLTLCGCSLSLPVRLHQLSDVRETILTESRDTPHMSMTLHPDGLGWQVLVNQSITRELATEAEEHWQYRTYDLSGHSSSNRPYNYDDICGLLLLTTPLLAPMNVEQPPYWTRWERLASACSSSPANSSRVLHENGRIREEKRRLLEAVSEGHLSLVWHSPGEPPIQARIPLHNNTRTMGTAVRLRWLAEMIRRTAHPLVMLQSGTVEMQFIQHDQVILRRHLSVLPEDLVASLSDDRVVSVPAEHWPRDLVVRIEYDPDSLPREDQAHLVQQTVAALNRLAVPVVLRGDELDRWRADQVRFHDPQFRNIPSVDPAHAAGATVLLHLEARTPFPQSRVLTMYAASITTGEILATLSAGGHESQWPFVIEMSMRELDFMLQHVLDHLPARAVSAQPLARPGGRP